MPGRGAMGVVDVCLCARANGLLANGNANVEREEEEEEVVRPEGGLGSWEGASGGVV